MVFTDLNQLQSVLLYDVLPLFFCLILTWLTVKKIHNEFYIFACLCLASLITITHLYHDFIFLLPALMIGTKFSKNLYSRIIIILVGLNWFGLTLLKFLGYSEAFIVVNYIFYTQLINLMIASLIMLCIFKISKRENLSINN